MSSLSSPLLHEPYSESPAQLPWSSGQQNPSFQAKTSPWARKPPTLKACKSKNNGGRDNNMAEDYEERSRDTEPDDGASQRDTGKSKQGSTEGQHGHNCKNFASWRASSSFSSLARKRLTTFITVLLWVHLKLVWLRTITFSHWDA